MEMKKLLSTIARQIENARNHAGIGERRGEESPLMDAVLGSLRVTYLALSAGLDPRKDTPHLFLLEVSETGDHVLFQGGTAVPVNAPFLAYLFWSGGVDLAPGQMLFLEPELAKAAIEEALGRVALDQAFAERERASRRRHEDAESLRFLETRTNLLWDRKIGLVAASLVAEEYLEQARARTDPEPEAA